MPISTASWRRRPDGIVLPKSDRRRGRRASRREARRARGRVRPAGRRNAHHRHRDRERRRRLRPRHLRRCEPPPHAASPGAARTCRPISAPRRTATRPAPTRSPTASRAPSRSSARRRRGRRDRLRLSRISATWTGLAAECREARRDGFVAKMAIHPAQVPVINEAFTPSAEAIERARAGRRGLRGQSRTRASSASTARCWTGRTCCGPNGFCAGPANSETPARKPQLHLSPDLGCSRDPFLLCKSGTPDLHGERSSAARVRGHRSIRIRRNPSPAPPARPLPQGEVGQSLTSTDYRSGNLPVNYKPDFELQPRSTKRDSRLTSCA